MSPAALPAPAGSAASGLRGRLLRAGAWVLAGTATSQLLRLVSSLLLTRLLMPEAVALVAAVQTCYLALVMLSDLGVWQAVVQRPHGMDARFLGTARSIQAVRGLTLAVVVLALAGGLGVAAGAGMFPHGTVFADPRLPPMMAAFALGAVIQGLESMRIAVAQRELRVGALARLEMLSQVGGMTVTLLLAAVTRSPWSLVAGSLAAMAARTWLSWRLPGGSTPFAWDAACRREITGFGQWIVVSSVIGFAASQGEKLLLGGLLPAGDFGAYAVAATLLAALAGVMSALNGHLVFPLLSHALRASPGDLKQAYARAQAWADVMLGFAAGVGLLAAGWVVQVLYDPRYANAGWMLQLLAPGLLAMRTQVLEQVMFARGLSAWVSGSNALRALALVLAVPWAHSAHGVAGAVAAVAASQFAGWPLALIFKHRQGLLDWRREGWFVPALAAGAATGWAIDTLCRLVLA